MFDVVFTCRLCKKETILGWHPLWKTKHICWKCRDKMYSKHKTWMDKLLAINKQKKEE